MAGIKWTKQENIILKKYYKYEHNEILIKRLPNRTRTAINLRARKLGLKKELSTYKRYGKIQNLLNESLDAYYWVGFIMADGYINHETLRLKFHLSKKDIKSMKRFSDFLEMNEFNGKYISLQDKENIPKLIKKFNFIKNKTVNPPKYKYKLSDKLIAFYCGFIDGDGCIQKHTNRNDAKISIKLYKTWKNFLIDMENNLYTYFKEEKYIKKSNVKINNCGYSYLSITSTPLLRKLKLFVIKNNIPVMERKWDKIDHTLKSKYELADIKYKKIDKLKKQGYNYTQISKILNEKYTTVYNLYRRRKVG